MIAILLGVPIFVCALVTRMLFDKAAEEGLLDILRADLASASTIQ